STSFGGATSAYASSTIPASSSQSRPRSRRTPSQPRWPTYGGTKNRSGSASASIPCTPAAAAHQIAKRPSPWWSVSTIRNAFLPRTKNVGAPWLRRSLVSGRPRQSFRSPPSVRSRSRAVSAVELGVVVPARERAPRRRLPGVVPAHRAEHGRSPRDGAVAADGADQLDRQRRTGIRRRLDDLPGLQLEHHDLP